MADDLAITGTEDLVQLGKALRGLGEKTILPTLRREINADTKAERTKIRDRIRRSSGLPEGGGMAKWAGRTPTTSSRVEKDRASVKIALQVRGHDIEALNRGRVRHPTFGHRPWVTQDIRAGWWERAAEPSAQDMADAVGRAIARAVERGVEAYKSGGIGS